MSDTHYLACFTVQIGYYSSINYDVGSNLNILKVPSNAPTAIYFPFGERAIDLSLKSSGYFEFLYSVKSFLGFKFMQ